jgi:hypothetical protein
MKPGDLVFIMGDPSRPILGKRRRSVAIAADLTPITHGTPALVLEVDGDVTTHRTHVKVLVQGEALWMPSGFVQPHPDHGILAS